jgi:sugar (pentulose or hexulose) kinase
MLFLGIDIGSSTIKGGVLDLRRKQVGPVVREPFPGRLENHTEGFHEVFPAAIVAATRDVLSRLLEIAPSAAGILVAGQMGGVILVDDRGAPLTNYLSWRDQRSVLPQEKGPPAVIAARECLSDDQFRALGSELMPGSATTLLFWLARRGALPRGACPATVADFAIARLCGGMPRWHRTQALGLLDLASGNWHFEALDRLGLADLAWPELVEEYAPVGFFAAGTHRIPCYAALGDQQCALRGAGLAHDELSVNVSTGSQVSRRTHSFEPGSYQTRAYFEGDFLNTITHLPAGRSLNVLVDLLSELARAKGLSVDDAWEYIARQAEMADGGGLTCDLAFFAGPLGSQGGISGITTDNLTIGNVFRAALASMAENYAQCASRIWPDRAWRQLALSGGLTQALPVLRRLIEQRFGSPLRESVATEETLLGLLDVANTLAQGQR